MFSSRASYYSNIGASKVDVREGAKQVSRDLGRRIDSLELACAGLWHLLKTQHGYTDDDLMKAIQEVDALDGKVDGKITKAVGTCHSCNRQLLSRKSPKCTWCGEDLAKGPF